MYKRQEEGCGGLSVSALSDADVDSILEVFIGWVQTNKTETILKLATLIGGLGNSQEGRANDVIVARDALLTIHSRLVTVMESLLEGSPTIYPMEVWVSHCLTGDAVTLSKSAAPPGPAASVAPSEVQKKGEPGQGVLRGWER